MNDYDPTANPMQAMVNEMGRLDSLKRAKTQITLGELIRQLELVSPQSYVRGLDPDQLHSYRGYYCDLAFAPWDNLRSVEYMLEKCKAAMGRVFAGYKGGDYIMGEVTPLWVASWGDDTGTRLMGLQLEGGVLAPVTEQEEWP